MGELIPAPLEGEILGAKDTVRVVVVSNVFKMDHVVLDTPAGLTVAEILDHVVDHTGDTRLPKLAVIRFNGDEVPRPVWHRLRPKAGTHILIRAVLRGGGGFLKAILPLALMAITAIVAPYLLPASIAVIGTSLAVSAAGLVGSLLAQPLTAHVAFRLPNRAACAEETP